MFRPVSWSLIGEMLHVANDVLRLLALHEIADHCSSQQRIFSRVLEGPSIPRFARKIYAPTQRHVEALRSQLSTDQRAVLAGALRIPAGSGRQIRWERRRVAAIRPAVANAIGGIRNEYWRNAQSLHPFDIACAAIREMRSRASAIGKHAPCRCHAEAQSSRPRSSASEPVRPGSQERGRSSSKAGPGSAP